MNFRDTIGYGREAIPAMDAAPAVTDSIVELCKAILERLGATPADPDDSLLTITGQRDDAAIAMNVASDGTDTLIELARSILERVGETPADSDDSVHTIIGQRDGTQATGILSGTDTVVAMLKQVITQQGLIYFGDITTAANVTSFASTNLIGYEDGFFDNWYAYIVRDDAGAHAAPQNEYRLISAYTTAAGTFTIAAFSAAHIVGDQVMIIHPMLYEILTIRGGAYTIQDVMEEHQAQLDIAEYSTVSIVCDGTEQTLYEVTGSSHPYFFGGGYVDFTAANFGAGEDTTVKVKVKTDGTAYTVVYEETFLAAALPANPGPAVPFPRTVNTQTTPDTFYTKQDVIITITQAAVGGGFNTLDYRIIDAQRGG